MLHNASYEIEIETGVIGHNGGPPLDLEYERPYLYPKQLAAIFEPKRYSLIEASTKAGKTSGCITWIVEQAFGGRAGQNYWWVAPVSDQARIAFRRTMRAVPSELYTANLTDKTITLFNGAVIWFKSGDKPNSLYGEDVYAAVVDEASRMKEDAYIAIRSTLTYTRGPVRIIGNVRGRKNWFFKLARRAEHGDDEMAYHKIVAADAVSAGVLDGKEIEDARTQMPEASWRELYLAEASDDGGNPFGLQHIAGCILKSGLSTNPVAWWGWDFAKRHDYTVGIGLDKFGYVAKLERFHGMPWDQILDHVTPASKQKLMEGLAIAIQSRGVGYPDGVIVDELEQFEFEYTRTGVRYAAPAGYYDDCVCALALAQMCRTSVPAGMSISPEIIAQVMASGGGQRRRM
jgi:hypothetical protein